MLVRERSVTGSPARPARENSVSSLPKISATQRRITGLGRRSRGARRFATEFRNIGSVCTETPMQAPSCARAVTTSLRAAGPQTT